MNALARRFETWRANRWAERMDNTFWHDDRVRVLAVARDNRLIADRRAMEAELAEVRRYIERLTWAARLGNEKARRRLRALTFNTIGAAAEKLASAALAELDPGMRTEKRDRVA